MSRSEPQTVTSATYFEDPAHLAYQKPAQAHLAYEESAKTSAAYFEDFAHLAIWKPLHLAASGPPEPLMF